MPINYLDFATYLFYVAKKKSLKHRFTDEEKKVLSQLQDNFKSRFEVDFGIYINDKLDEVGPKSESPSAEVISETTQDTTEEDIMMFVEILVQLMSQSSSIKIDFHSFCPSFFASINDLKTFLRTSGIEAKGLEKLSEILGKVDSKIFQTLSSLANHEIWYDFVVKEGISVISEYLVKSNITEIVAKLPQGITRLSFAEVEKEKAKFLYNLLEDEETSARKLELAILCSKYNRSPKAFNVAVQAMASLKASDKLPNIFIDGTELGYPGFYYAKLPPDDLRGFLLGEITHCCQSVGENAQNVAIDGMTSEFSGFYCIFKRNGASPNIKNDVIVGQSYIWFSQQGNWVLDSLEIVGQRFVFGDENGTDNTRNAAVFFLRALAVHINYVSTKLLFLGTGGGTADIYDINRYFTETRETQLFIPTKLPSGAKFDGYGDAAKQYLIKPVEYYKGYLVEPEKQLPLTNVGDVVCFYAARDSDRQKYIFGLINGNELFLSKLNPCKKCLVQNYAVLSPEERSLLIGLTDYRVILNSDMDKEKYRATSAKAVFEEYTETCLSEIKCLLNNFPELISCVVSVLVLPSTSIHVSDEVSVAIVEFIEKLEDLECALKLLEWLASVQSIDSKTKSGLTIKLLNLIFLKCDDLTMLQVRTLCKMSVAELYFPYARLKYALKCPALLQERSSFVVGLYKEIFKNDKINGHDVCELIWMKPQLLEDSDFESWLAKNHGTFIVFLNKKVNNKFYNNEDYHSLFAIYIKTKSILLEKLLWEKLQKLLEEKLAEGAQTDAELSLKLAEIAREPNKQRGFLLRAIEIAEGNSELKSILSQAKETLLNSKLALKVRVKNTIMLNPLTTWDDFSQLGKKQGQNGLTLFGQGYCQRKGVGGAEQNLLGAWGFFTRALHNLQPTSSANTEEDAKCIKQQLVITQSALLLREMVSIKWQLSSAKYPLDSEAIEVYNTTMQGLEVLRVEVEEDKKNEDKLTKLLTKIGEVCANLQKHTSCLVINEQIINLGMVMEHYSQAKLASEATVKATPPITVSQV